MSRTGGTNAWSRRRLLGTALAAAAAVPLSACASAGSPDGRLRVAFPTSGGKESLDPHTGELFVDQARAKALFDTLVAYADDMSVVPRLARSWRADPTGTRWSIRLREARFHDGRPVTAEDVLHSYRRIADPATSSEAAKQFQDVDFAASRAASPTELELVLRKPNFEFPSAWGAPSSEIVPAGTTDFRAPIGSGPFRFESFEPGGVAKFARFEDHWSGPAVPTGLDFVPIEEETARASALMSGQVHYAHDIGANSAQLLDRDRRARVLTSERGTMQAVALKVDREPFDDPRVVRAILEGVDRQALVDVALGGRGQLGNDLFGAGLEHYPPDLPQRRQNVARARSLLRDAGAEGLAFELRTSTADPYFEPAASLLAEQLSDIGVRASPRIGPSETYFSDIKDTGAAAQTRTATLPITTFLEQRMRGSAGSNYTKFSSSEFDRLFDEALSTADGTDRARLLADAQRIARDESGLLVWGFSDWNVGTSAELRGVRAAPPNSLDWARFERARFEGARFEGTGAAPR